MFSAPVNISPFFFNSFAYSYTSRNSQTFRYSRISPLLHPLFNRNIPFSPHSVFSPALSACSLTFYILRFSFFPSATLLPPLPSPFFRFWSLLLLSIRVQRPSLPPSLSRHSQSDTLAPYIVKLRHGNNLTFYLCSGRLHHSYHCHRFVASVLSHHHNGHN